MTGNRYQTVNDAHLQLLQPSKSLMRRDERPKAVNPDSNPPLKSQPSLSVHSSATVQSN